MRKNSPIILILGLVFLGGLAFGLYPIREFSNETWAQTGSISATVKIAYAEETYQVDTTQSFEETLSNPNNSKIDIGMPADVLSSGEAVELTVYSTLEETVTVDKPLPSGKSAANIFYNISFKKVSDSNAVSSFDKAITLTFYYTDSDISGIDESVLIVYRWNGSEWVALSDSVVDVDLNRITATTQQFSFFAILGDVLPLCGNNTIETGEQCDGSDLDGQTCVSRGYDGGALNCKPDCTFDISGCTSSPPPSGGGGGSTVPLPVSTDVVIKGKAYPLSSITVLQDGRVAATTIADSQANFTVGITDMTPGIYTFSAWALDKQGRRSITFSFTTNIAKDMTTTISGIFLPPTIELSKALLQKGETFNVLGQTAPGSDISIFVNSPEIVKKTQAGADGTWFYAFDTTLLEEGSHTARAKATSPEGLLSTFSQTLAFSVGKETTGVTKKADTNKDGKVNLVDFSILLYNWGVPKNPDADLNNDGKVNLVDFSIMLYWWTG